jgi:bifunctional non-homologous end joining protein LigD
MAGLAFIAPCTPVLAPHPPAGEGWAHEIKHDGYRLISTVQRGEVRIYTRRDHDWTNRMPGIAEALARLKLRAAVIDGEAVMLDKAGIADFFPLHAALTAGAAPAAMLVAFDLLHLDGRDMRQAPLEERRARFASLIGAPAAHLQFSEPIPGDGEHEELCGSAEAGLNEI